MIKYLFFVIKATSQGHTFEFQNNSCTLKNKDNHVVGEGIHENWLYKLQCPTKSSTTAVETTQLTHFARKQINNMNLWLLRFGHLGVEDLNSLHKRILLMVCLWKHNQSCCSTKVVCWGNNTRSCSQRKVQQGPMRFWALYITTFGDQQKHLFSKEQGISSCSLMMHFRSHFAISWRWKENAFPSSWSLRFLQKTKLGRSCRLYEMIMEGNMCQVNFKNN